MKQNNILYQEKMAQLIKLSGGEIDDTGLFVTKPGCMILSMTQETEQGKNIYQHFNIDINRPDYEQRAEFKSRMTYLSFPSERLNATDYNVKMAQEYQHLSVHHSTQIDFLIAGVTIETCLELVAHSEANVARLTSSNTKAMNAPLYRLQGTEEEQALQKKFILNFMELKQSFEQDLRFPSKKGTEYTNMLNLCTKVSALTYSMNLKDYHKLFIGRLSEQGNEQEIQEICTSMCQLLYNQFPLVIRAPEEYYAMNNGMKYLNL